MTIKQILKSLTAIALCSAIVLFPLSAYASVLGSSKIDGYTTKIGEGLFFTHNLFYSDQSGVGKQSENYLTYTPNSTVIPSITFGTALYGGNTLSNQVSTMENSGVDVLGGTNADFFSTQTLVPMSNAIVDGKILTKDASGQDAIGIMEDGTAFISYVFFNSAMTREDGSSVAIHNINKFRQPYAAYLLTPEFSDTTRNTTKGFDIILGSIEGEMKIGTKMTAVVESVTENSSAIAIPKDKLVLTVDSNAPKEILTPISTLKVGEKVTFSFSATGDERWSQVKVGMGSVGGRLLIGGEVNPNLSAGAAPRTAIGIKQDGSIVLYTIDGRQEGHSYGVQLKTLAKRMQELGCVEALNLDGGGSTAITAQLPGNSSSTLMNKPSDKKERNLSTHFMFTNTAKKTGVAAQLHLYPITNYILKGATLQLTLKATDSGFYPTELPGDVEYFVQDGKESTVSQSGLFTAKDSSLVEVFAQSGDIKTSTSVTCLETPTSITVKNKETDTELKSLNLDPGDSITLSAEAFGGYNKLISSADCYRWECDNEIGSIDENQTFTASDRFGAKGNIYVSAGSKTVTVPVTLIAADSTDPKAYPIIDMTFEKGSLTGKISCEYNILTHKEGITVKADGKAATDVYYNPETGEFTAPLSKDVQKITIYATNEFGYTTFKTMTVNSADPESPFADTSGHWAEDILSYMYSQKIINGEVIDKVLHFNPQKPMTRSEFAVMVVNFLGLDKAQYSDVSLPYSDLSTIPFWALDSFKALYELGIVKGRYVTETESCADPLASISRAEAATIVARILPKGLFKTEITAPDKAEIAAWAENGFSTLLNIGAMKGYEDGSLMPSIPLTKSEAAKILYSAM